MAKFLTREEIYRLLQRELPEGVYPDGSEDKFYSTADMASVADVVASGYDNAKKIYDNYFPRTADEKLADWEILAFGRALDKSLGLEVRRDRVEQKIRTRKGITKQDVLDTVRASLGTDKLVEIVELCNETGTWLLNFSELSINTILNNTNGVDVVGFGPCETDFASYGKTEEEWEQMRFEAYTYEIRVYGYYLTEVDLLTLDEQLKSAEPVRCNRIIVDGLNPETMLGMNFTGFVSFLTESGDTLNTESGDILGLG
jgi:uncharacterized protein YmfQ (DUF2313 family)